MRKRVKVEWPIKNKQLYAEIVKSKELDKLTPEAEQMLIILANRASLKLPYKNEEDRKDCISSAHLDLLKYWRGFNPIYPNAFAYYTEIAKKGFAKGWNKLHPKKYHGTVSLDGGYGDDSDGIYSI